MRCISALFAVGLMIFQAPANAQIGPTTPIGAKTVPDFLKGCDRDRNGCQLAVGSALLAKLEIADGPAQVCQPSGSDVGAPVVNWLRAHPETQNLPADDAIYAALKSLYPCGPAEKQAAAQ